MLSRFYGIGHFSLDNYLAMISGQAPNTATQGDCAVFSDFVASARHGERIERFDGRCGLALDGAKRREIVMADEHRCGVRHGLRIERVRNPPDALAASS